MFSPDGQSFYFTRAANKITNIYISKYDGRQWTEPVLAPFTEGRYSDADPAFGPDGKLYFISNRPARQPDTLMDYDIWRVSPLAGGRWSEPENLKGINTDSAEYYISFTANGNLYFASSRPGGFGEEDIYVSRPAGQQYSQPENLGAAVNTDKSEYDPFISPKEDFLIFTSSNRGDGFGAADLYCSKLKGGKEWLQAANLGKSFNTSTREFCPYLSPDGKYFFFSSERDIKWISAGHLTRQMEKLW
jgi:Tol biopolymer transport system component